MRDLSGLGCVSLGISPSSLCADAQHGTVRYGTEQYRVGLYSMVLLCTAHSALIPQSNSWASVWVLHGLSDLRGSEADPAPNNNENTDTQTHTHRDTHTHTNTTDMSQGFNYGLMSVVLSSWGKDMSANVVVAHICADDSVFR